MRAGYRVPWLRAIEAHADGSAHIHVAIAWAAGWRDERQSRVLAGLWGLGHVDLAKGRNLGALGRREQARAVARYVVKYAVKDIEGGQLERGEHSYEVAQGFRPVPVRARAWSRTAGVASAIGMMGGEIPRYQWESGDSREWTGPPIVFLGW